MARTKQTASKSTGGRAPRKKLKRKKRTRASQEHDRLIAALAYTVGTIMEYKTKKPARWPKTSEEAINKLSVEEFEALWAAQRDAVAEVQRKAEADAAAEALMLANVEEQQREMGYSIGSFK